MKRKILSIILLLIWMVVIFCFSASNGDESSKVSINVTNTVNTTIQTEKTHDLEIIIRKCAHSIEYAILALLTLNVLNNYNIKYKYILSLIFSVIYACSDEYHQLYVPGRSGRLIDIFIDFIGAFIAILIIYIIINILNKRKKV